MSKTALITGSAGFIGRHVCRALIASGWDVTGVHRDGYADKPYPTVEGLDEKVVNLSKPLRFTKDYHAVVNLASESHVERSIQEPQAFVENNVSVMLNVLEACRHNPPKMLIHISTDKVFGPANNGQFYEEWDRHIPSSPYSASKSCQDMMCCAWWRTYGVPVVIVRLMNNFGPKQNAEKMIPKLVRCLMAGESVPVHAERTVGSLLSQNKWTPGSRTWLHADNTADAIRFILANVTPEKYPESDRPTCFHVAGDLEVDNAELVHRAAKILGVEPKIEYVDFHTSRPGHDRRYALAGRKLRDLGWVPPMDFEESFRKTVLELAGKAS